MTFKRHGYYSPFIVSLYAALMAGLSSDSLFAQYQNGNVNSVPASPSTAATSTAIPPSTGPVSGTVTTPATPGKTPTTGPSTSTAPVQKPKICGEQTFCIINATSGAEFLNYFGKCHDLEGASIVWKASPSIVLTIKTDKDAYCSMTINNALIPDNPTVKTCTFNSNQIANMVTANALTAVKDYEKSGGANVNKLKDAMQPIMDCLGPLPNYEKDSSPPPDTTNTVPPTSGSTPINTNNTDDSTSTP